MKKINILKTYERNMPNIIEYRNSYNYLKNDTDRLLKISLRIKETFLDGKKIKFFCIYFYFRNLI